MDERRARKRSVRELRDGAVAGLRVRIAPEHGAERHVDELRVGALLHCELRGDTRIHQPYS